MPEIKTADAATEAGAYTTDSLSTDKKLMKSPELVRLLFNSGLLL